MTRRRQSVLGALLCSATFICFAPAETLGGEITGFTGISGDGFVFSDPDEGVIAPGIKAVTVIPNNDDRTSRNGFSPASGPGSDPADLDYNCLMSNNPSISCNSPPGLGKRIKTNWTGRNAFDLTFALRPTRALPVPSGGTAGVTEYFTFGKVTNQTNARVTGFQMVLGTGKGNDFVVMDANDPERKVLFDQLSALTDRAATWPGLGGETTGQNPLQRAFFPDGLFGNGGQEGDIGFFDPENAGFVLVQNGTRTVLTATELFNAFHIANFGDGLLPRNLIPDGYFWDDNGIATDESALVAWHDKSANNGRGAWLYGAVGIDDPSTGNVNELEVRLEELASALGVTVAQLGYEPGAEIPARVLAAMQASDEFDVDGIEDLSNLNLNFSIDVGDILGGEFTLRLLPVFAPIVATAATDLQYGVAVSLDTANIPFLGIDPALADVADEIMALPTLAERRDALERTGYSYLGAFGELAYTMGRGQIEGAMAKDTITGLPKQSTDVSGGTQLAYGGGGLEGTALALASQDANGRWELGEQMSAFVSVGGSTGDRDASENGAAFDFTSWNVTGGVDYEFFDNFSVGLAGGYTGANADVEGNRGELDANGYAAMLYANGNFGDGGWMDAALGYQWLDYDSTRLIAFGNVSERADGSTDGGQFFMGARGGWDFREGDFTVGPVARAELFVWDVDGFTESGTPLAMTIDDQDGTVFHGGLGIQGSYESKHSWGVVRPYGRIGVAGRTGDDEEVLTAFGGVPGFNTPVAGGEDIWLDLAAGVSALVYDDEDLSARISINYEGALLSEEYTEHRGTLGLTFNF